MIKDKRKYGALFLDADVKRWYGNVGRGSKVTADVYLRRLGSFCETRGLTPGELVTKSEKRIYDLLLDYVSSEEKCGHAGSYIQSTIKAVKSWLVHNDREIKRKIKISGAQDTPTLTDERVPTKEELKRIFLSGDKKTRTASVLVAHGGLRIETVGNYLGDDGLRIKDLPELSFDGGEVKFEQVPALVVVRKELSKARHKYFTFLGEEGCGYLKDYLEERMRGGEKLTPESAVVTPKLRRKAFIRSINVGDAIRGAIRKAGFSWRPYVLRAYFDTQLMLAESKGLILRDYRQFMMGHKGDIEARYTTNKGRLPNDVIDNMRDAYTKSQEYLQTMRPELPSEEDIKKIARVEFNRIMLLRAGFKPEEIEKMDLASLTDKELWAKAGQKYTIRMKNNGMNQKVVSVDEIEDNIKDGWEFVASLPNGKVVLKLPL